MVGEELSPALRPDTSLREIKGRCGGEETNFKMFLYHMMMRDSKKTRALCWECTSKTHRQWFILSTPLLRTWRWSPFTCTFKSFSLTFRNRLMEFISASWTILNYITDCKTAEPAPGQKSQQSWSRAVQLCKSISWIQQHRNPSRQRHISQPRAETALSSTVTCQKHSVPRTPT